MEKGNIEIEDVFELDNSRNRVGVKMRKDVVPVYEFYLCTSPEKTDTEIWLTNTVSGLTRTLHFIQGRKPA